MSQNKSLDVMTLTFKRENKSEYMVLMQMHMTFQKCSSSHLKQMKSHLVYKDD